MSQIEVKVPDIGDSGDVDVIEVLVKPGDSIELEQSLIVLESDKASMDVPSSAAGKVVDVKVKVGDKVNAGSVILTVESQAGAATSAPAVPVGGPQAAPAAAPGATPAAAPLAAPTAAQHSGSADITCDMLVLGAGPGGY